MKIIKRIAPLQMGKILAVFYTLFSIIMVPIIVISTILKEETSAVEIILMVILIPLAYIAIGFVGGIIAAAFYNLCAKLVGGIKITLEDEEVIQS